MPTQISATVEHVVECDVASGWHVLDVRNSTDTLVRAVGFVRDVFAGLGIVCEGTWSEYEGCPALFLSDYRCFDSLYTRGIRNLLASEHFEGIGPVLASRLVETFGADVTRIISDQPDRLCEIAGLDVSSRRSLVSGIQELGQALDAKIFLYARVGPAQAARLYAIYGESAHTRIAINPYRLIEDLSGVSFATADALALTVGYDVAGHHRLTAAAVHVLQQAQSQGHTVLEGSILISRLIALTRVRPVILGEILRRMLDTRVLVSFETKHRRFIGLPEMARYENDAAQSIQRIAQGGSCLSGLGLLLQVDDVASRLSMPLSEEQHSAVSSVIGTKITVLTGGAGTGKTAVLSLIGALLSGRRLKLHLCAPTGIAARRMRDVTGLDAVTIHRLLEVGEGGIFGRNCERRLAEGLVVIDEASMCDTYILNALLAAVSSETHILLIGDCNQLPSVGAGSVLRDLIGAPQVQACYLTRNFRVGGHGAIFSACESVLAGRWPTADMSGAYRFRAFSSADEIVDEIIALVPSFVRNRSFADLLSLQVITPRNSGPLSVDRLNTALQNLLNNGGRECYRVDERSYRVGDKVMQTVNDPDREVLNGDIGHIEAYDSHTSVAIVRFKERAVQYDSSSIRQLRLAYAVTVHKAQGAEFSAVIFAVDNSSFPLLDRSLIYTAMSRAQRNLVIVGSKATIGRSISARNRFRRTTTMRLRLSALDQGRQQT